ncbi:hypothetical protein PC115_g8264 [Phytophthora cactorum]|nr:hypothetical protein PC115_g8264 [Phytophthora cactorum]KAG3087790.1 hypothetical protein PC122_g8686 [Phytophthora cactorum]
MSSGEDEVKLKRPLVAVSPVKLADSAKQTATRFNATKKNRSVIQTLLSIDAESALHLVKRSTKAARKEPKQGAHDEALDSDAYSPFPKNSSSEEGDRKYRSVASAKRKLPKKKSANKKENESKRSDANSSDGGLSDSSRDRPRQKPQRTKFARKTVKNRHEPTVPSPNEALRVIFGKYDVDGDGAISFIDLRRAMDKQMTGQTHRLSDMEIQRWITEKDRSGQGVVSFEDFAVAFQKQLNQ